MSAGHHHRGPSVSDRELDEVLAEPAVKRELAKKRRLITIFDVPYWGGSSVDGLRIYRDRHAKPIAVKGRTVDVTGPVTRRHEPLEWILMRVFVWPYRNAHAFASKWENRDYIRMGLDPDAVNKALEPQIKADAHEKLTRVPPDLFLGPVISPPKDAKLLAHLRKVMDRPEPKIPKATAEYSVGKMKSHCGNCGFYGNRDCAIVSGAIDHKKWCVFWGLKGANDRIEIN